ALICGGIDNHVTGAADSIWGLSTARLGWPVTEGSCPRDHIALGAPIYSIFCSSHGDWDYLCRHGPHRAVDFCTSGALDNLLLFLCPSFCAGRGPMAPKFSALVVFSQNRPQGTC